MSNGYRRIYYDLATGDKIAEIAFDNNFIPQTIEQEISKFTILSERNRDTFDVLELPYGAHAQNFAESNGYRVNPETKELEFSYPDPNKPEAEPVYVKPLTEQIAVLNEKQALMQAAIDDLIFGGGF